MSLEKTEPSSLLSHLSPVLTATLSVTCCPVCTCQGHVDVLKSLCLSFLFHCRQAAGWGDGE